MSTSYGPDLANFQRVVESSKKELLRRALAKQGTRRVRPIDPNEYPPIRGMEGPFRFRKGHILYYDPREGKYYDRGQDRYLSNREAEVLTMGMPDMYGNLSEVVSPTEARSLFIFDFDHTLFKSPNPPKGWPEDPYWWQDVRSISPPCVPQKPPSKWWNGPVVARAKKAIAAKGAYTVMMSGRAASFGPRIRELLKQQGLDFDQVMLASRGRASAGFKVGAFGRILAKFPGIKTVIIYDDWPPHSKVYAEAAKKAGLKVKVNDVEIVAPKAECPPPTEEVMRQFNCLLDKMGR